MTSNQCPKCGHEQTCPCKTCQEKNPTDKPWVHEDNDFVACGNCGFSEHIDYWMDRCYREYKRKL